VQTAGSSGSADIAELANQPNYSYLPVPVNTDISHVSYCQLNAWEIGPLP
jgi:hypothetical protein